MLPPEFQLTQEFIFFLIVTKKIVTSLVASVLYQCKTEKGLKQRFQTLHDLFISSRSSLTTYNYSLKREQRVKIM